MGTQEFSLKRKLQFLLLPVSLLLLLLVIHCIGFSNLYNVIVRANLNYLILAVAFQVSSILVRNFKWQIFVNEIKKVPFSFLLVISLAGSFMDTVTPGLQVGGGPLKAYFLSKETKVDKATCLSTVLVEKITSVCVIGFFGICSTFFILIFIQNVSLIVKMLLEFVLVFIVGVPILGYVLMEKYKGKSFKGRTVISKIYYFGPFSFLRKRFKTLQAFDDYVRQKLSDFVQTFLKLSNDRKKVSVNIVLAFLAWMLSFTNTYVLFLAFDYPVSFFAILIVISLSVFLSSFPLMPGIAGVTELLMISLYISFGISSAIAASVALLDRFIFYLFSLGLGYISLNYLNFRYGGY